ncbi:hypothetical protein OQ351_001792 [Escherichia coli]|nr:hypothetical protein [Escherichia coli]
MEVGKTYIINPLSKNDFANECRCNAMMLKLIEKHGPSFVVNEIESDDCAGECVVRVTMEDGTEYSAGGPLETYFEIYSEEFKYFTEVTLEKPQQVNEGIDLGVTKIHCVVDKTNVDEIIELLQKTFKK